MSSLGPQREDTCVMWPHEDLCPHQYTYGGFLRLFKSCRVRGWLYGSGEFRWEVPTSPWTCLFSVWLEERSPGEASANSAPQLLCGSAPKCWGRSPVCGHSCDSPLSRVDKCSFLEVEIVTEFGSAFSSGTFLTEVGQLAVAMGLHAGPPSSVHKWVWGNPGRCSSKGFGVCCGTETAVQLGPWSAASQGRRRHFTWEKI